jgi:hypothetical protein
MEEAAFLVAVQRVSRGVEVENDLLWRRLAGVEKRSTNRRSIA